MWNILEDLYHGNISVTERTFKRNSTFAKALNRATEIEDAIRTALPGDKKDLAANLGAPIPIWAQRPVCKIS